MDDRNSREICDHGLWRIHHDGRRGACWVGDIAGPPGEHVAIGGRGGERDARAGVIEPSRGHRDGPSSGGRHTCRQLILGGESRGSSIGGSDTRDGDVMGDRAAIGPTAENILGPCWPGLWRSGSNGDAAADGILAAYRRNPGRATERDRQTRRRSLKSHCGKLAARQHEVLNLR